MIKYSFIVPFYNTSKYLKRCLDSLIGQSFNNFEVILINDGSTDNSLDILNKYKKNNSNVIIINQENKGLSEARNVGVKKAKGKYIIFIDSDDYVNTNFLEEIDIEIKDLDILRYQIVTEDENGKDKIEYHEYSFDRVGGIDAFRYISSYHFVEPAWCYVINREYYIKNKFSFKKGVYHEDFGLIPYVIYKAESVKSIDYIGYHYVQRDGSIMNNGDYKKTVKKAFDMLNQYKSLRLFSKSVNKKNNTNDYYLSYISNSVIVKARELKGAERKEYINELKKIHAFDGIIVNTKIRKLKKMFMKLNLGLYLRIAR